MNVLAIDTSNQPMSVALLKDQQLAAELTVNVKRNHSIQLMPAIDYILNQAGLLPKDLNLIAVAEGPGSYTGLRIGMTTAKTLAWTLNLPIVAISSLEMLAANLMYHNSYICPFFDARRGNVYTGLYKATQGKIEQVEDDFNTAMEEWLDELKALNEPIWFISSTDHSFDHIIKDKLGEHAILIKHSLNFPKAGVLASLALECDPTPVHELKPQYHRMVEAEAKWLEQNQKR
ncbi:tRNA (adenosine(37)-N6)-threonylcarbamoyltransferase complex dimerization subunit type 1 TsaB [Alkalibacillus silvisoli]|uniref:tRNA (Adenosine(37)-N6)-threonylcarbamoyltransferase complex dimerization subunit type 1 TsaB n=1 Tax=Alkalibacillus silvisoli TaxID=392823 RepID=A0ABN0ZQ29_9BACI